MTALWIEGNTLHRIEEMPKSKLVEILSGIFKNQSFKEARKEYMRKKLTSLVTSVSMTMEDF